MLRWCACQPASIFRLTQLILRIHDCRCYYLLALRIRRYPARAPLRTPSLRSSQSYLRLPPACLIAWPVVVGALHWLWSLVSALSARARLACSRLVAASLSSLLQHVIVLRHRLFVGGAHMATGRGQGRARKGSGVARVMRTTTTTTTTNPLMILTTTTTVRSPVPAPSFLDSDSGVRCFFSR